MNPQQVQIVQDTYNMILQYEEPFAFIFYSRLFTDNPDLQLLFSGRVKQQHDIFHRAMTQLIDQLTDPRIFVDILPALGQRHSQYGLTASHYAAFGKALLETFEDVLDEAWTPDVEEAWLALYKMVSDSMLSHVDDQNPPT